MKIKRIRKKTYKDKIPVYCLNILPNHEVIIQCDNKAYITKQSVNFQLEFGATAFNFAKTVIEPEWSMDEVHQYIRDNKLERKVEFFRKILEGETIQEDEERQIIGNKKEFYQNAINNIQDFKYIWTVASDIRKKFFKQYEQLGMWVERIPREADQNGYVRSPFGTIRRLPQLLYQGKEDSRGTIKNLHNISLNSPVQNYENVLMILTGVVCNNYIKEYGLKTRICGDVHDALIFYTYKDEFDEITKVAKQEFEQDRPENKGIPLELESNIADYYESGEVWGFGKEL